VAPLPWIHGWLAPAAEPRWPQLHLFTFLFFEMFVLLPWIHGWLDRHADRRSPGAPCRASPTRGPPGPAPSRRRPPAARLQTAPPCCRCRHWSAPPSPPPPPPPPLGVRTLWPLPPSRRAREAAGTGRGRDHGGIAWRRGVLFKGSSLGWRTPREERHDEEGVELCSPSWVWLSGARRDPRLLAAGPNRHILALSSMLGSSSRTLASSRHLRADRSWTASRSGVSPRSRAAASAAS
jgi:hypothetical protein